MQYRKASKELQKPGYEPVLVVESESDREDEDEEETSPEIDDDMEEAGNAKQHIPSKVVHVSTVVQQ